MARKKIVWLDDPDETLEDPRFDVRYTLAASLEMDAVDFEAMGRGYNTFLADLYRRTAADARRRGLRTGEEYLAATQLASRPMQPTRWSASAASSGAVGKDDVPTKPWKPPRRSRSGNTRSATLAALPADAPSLLRELARGVTVRYNSIYGMGNGELMEVDTILARSDIWTNLPAEKKEGWGVRDGDGIVMAQKVVF